MRIHWKRRWLRCPSFLLWKKVFGFVPEICSLRLTVGLLLRLCFLFFRIGFRRNVFAWWLITHWFKVWIVFHAIFQGRESIQHRFCAHYFFFGCSVIDLVQCVLLYWDTIVGFEVLACLKRTDRVKSTTLAIRAFTWSTTVSSATQQSVWSRTGGWVMMTAS